MQRATLAAAFAMGFAAATLLPLQDHGAGQPHHERHRAGSPLAAPPAIQAEHEHLTHDLAAARRAGGKTAAHAEEVARILHAHFEGEEAWAMPPLGLLEPLARGDTIDAAIADEAISMAQRLRDNYDQMLQEHKQLTEALKNLAEAARAEENPDQERFAESLMLHAQNEEQVLYPATLVIGEYLKLRRQQDGR